jgi:hypothetical protein
VECGRWAGSREPAEMRGFLVLEAQTATACPAHMPAAQAKVERNGELFSSLREGDVGTGPLYYALCATHDNRGGAGGPVLPGLRVSSRREA